jgi:hypothetical protein
VAKLTFPGTAGQKVFLDVESSTVPNSCGVLTLRAPDGQVSNSGCIIDGKGSIDRTVLAATGTYTVELDPTEANVGEARLRLYVATDQEGTIGLGGAPVTATVTQPGAVARFTFTASAGQRIFADATEANLPNTCGVLLLLGPDGNTMTSGCVINGAGQLESGGTLLKDSGTYALVLDPPQRDTGSMTLKLHT